MTRDTVGMDIGFIQTLDNVCSEINEAAGDRRLISSVHVPPRIYDFVATAKSRQHLSRGNPLLLLGLDLVRDEDLAPGQFKIL